MPDEADIGGLYERDFHAWSRQQADALRAARDAIRQGGALRQDLPALLRPFDWDNLVEELETLGRSERRALASQLSRIVQHLVKLQFSPAQEPRAGWQDTVRAARGEIRDILADSPSLRREVAAMLQSRTPDAIRDAADSMQDHGETAAAAAARMAAGYTEPQVLGDWWPDRDADPAGGSLGRPADPDA